MQVDDVRALNARYALVPMARGPRHELRFPATGPGLMPAQGKLEWIDGNGNLMPRGRP